MGDNLKFQSGQVSEAHEIYHAQLQGISVAGILMNILDLEQAAADSLDQRHAEHVQKINLILEQRTRKIHEIYANSMELASLYQYGGFRACLKIHSRHLHAPLRGIFGPNSVSVAHYASFIGAKSPTKCNVQLPESNFQTHSRAWSG